MPIGYSDLKNVMRLPQTWDAGYLTQFALKDGTTIDQLVNQIGAALVLFNNSLTQSYWGSLLRTTTDLTVDDPIGGEGGNELAVVSEYGRPDPIRGDATGHMLPMKDYGGKLGWTYLGLRRMIRGRAVLDVRRLIERSQNTFEKRILERLFKSAVDTVGGTGKSVPFADGGTADSDYIPPTFKGKSFVNTHTHFLRNTADATGRSAFLAAATVHLLEHGILPPYDLIIPEADKAAWAAQTEFKKPFRDALTTTAVETRALVAEETYLGIVETADAWLRVTYTPRLPTAYAGVVKQYGNESPDSPLVVRYEAGFPLGLVLVAQNGVFPLQDADVYFTFGVGVSNRLAGVLGYFAAAGGYVDPTIS